MGVMSLALNIDRCSFILSELGPYIGTAGVTTIALGAFIKYTGTKWIDNRYAKELPDLKSYTTGASKG